LKRKVAEKELAECTFKPKINKHKGSSRAWRKSRQQRLEELSQTRKLQCVGQCRVHMCV